MVECTKVCDCCKRLSTNLLECGSCRAVLYCTKECQIKHWNKLHRQHCRGHCCGDPNDLESMWDWKELFTNDLNKSEIFNLAFPKAELFLNEGYSLLPSLALSLGIPRKIYVDALRYAPGMLTEKEMSLFVVWELGEVGLDVSPSLIFEELQRIPSSDAPTDNIDMNTSTVISESATAIATATATAFHTP